MQSTHPDEVSPGTIPGEAAAPFPGDRHRAHNKYTMPGATLKVFSLAIVLAIFGLTRCSPPAASEEFTCQGKDRCVEMSSCAEARFYLEHCGVETMDGDNDGVPCEVEHCRR